MRLTKDRTTTEVNLEVGRRARPLCGRARRSSVGGVDEPVM